MNTHVSPLLYLSLNQLFNSLNEMANTKKAISYPPTDLIRVADNHYRLQMAVAGFSKEDIQLTLVPNEDPRDDREVLIIEGKLSAVDDKVDYIQHGIARRAFKHKVMLDFHSKVDTINLKDGMLTVDFKVELPEAKKPRTLEIGASD